MPLDPLVEGVRQDSLEHLERSLEALRVEYESGRHAEVRQVVIRAREHAELAARNRRLDEDRRALKKEMVLWLHTWLENPPMFPVWVTLRRKVIVK